MSKDLPGERLVPGDCASDVESSGRGLGSKVGRYGVNGPLQCRKVDRSLTESHSYLLEGSVAIGKRS